MPSGVPLITGRKKLFHNYAFVGGWDITTGDFHAAHQKPAGARPPSRTNVPNNPRPFQEGYNAPPAPANRVQAVPSIAGLGKVSRLRASEGQESQGKVDW